MNDYRIRRAQPDEADKLGYLAMEGVKYWRNELSHLEAVASLEENHLPTSG